MLRDGYQIHAENLSVQVFHASVVHAIDGIGIALNHVTKVVETVHGIVNVDAFAVHVNDVTTVDDVGDTGVEILQGLIGQSRYVV